LLAGKLPHQAVIPMHPPPSHKSSRREFARSIAACTATLAATDAFSQLSQVSSQPSLPSNLQEATLLPDFQQHVRMQKKLVWCWAATLESIFLAHGVDDLPQEDIVRQVWGAEVNLPSGDVFMLMGHANRNFRTRGGRTMGLKSRILSADIGFSEFHNGDLVEALSAGKPCILCTMTHMMVLTSLKYSGKGSRTQIWPGTVMDPFPNPQFPGCIRPMMEQELRIGNPRMPTANAQLRFMAIPELVKS